ncbi:holo-[acyl-carrier protein] synthase [Pseudoduganella flava]|uniref:Holo-[acyl-carrier-protein] synthase n=1 Tax=Pseudoduganella flava TaxID=871742 RepID=A0A562PZG8_9BURK|nr:holo-ACP synthase [Pseudoduganella flava]QGZ38643.1 holo-ACP synthase [Pseudoduganella flava]TWI49783.1 holo-[acyl-carrier protein] synthase [Pseudoduganella flava]
MIHGIGTDICKVPRIGEALARQGERFARRVLGPQELDVYRERAARNAVRGVRYVATRFAAKEAFSKALGLGLRPPMTWPAAQMLNDEQGKPQLVYSGALLRYMEEHRLTAQVSVSDEEEYAVAFVIVEKQR